MLTLLPAVEDDLAFETPLLGFEVPNERFAHADGTQD